MNFLKKLDHNLLTALIVFSVGVLGFLASCFLISTNLQDVPFGFLLAGGVIAFIHVVSYFLTLIDKRRGTTTFTIIAVMLRLVFLLVALVFIALMYYRWDIKLFNMFVFVGMYSLGIIVLCLTFIFIKD